MLQLKILYIYDAVRQADRLSRSGATDVTVASLNKVLDATMSGEVWCLVVDLFDMDG